MVLLWPVYCQNISPFNQWSPIGQPLTTVTISGFFQPCLMRWTVSSVVGGAASSTAFNGFKSHILKHDFCFSRVFDFVWDIIQSMHVASVTSVIGFLRAVLNLGYELTSGCPWSYSSQKIHLSSSAKSISWLIDSLMTKTSDSWKTVIGIIHCFIHCKKIFNRLTDNLNNG